MARIDVSSLIIGVLLSLLASGIYDAIFYFETGKTLEGYVAVTLVLVFASIILLIVAIIIDWTIFRRQRKKKDSVGMVETIEVVLNKKRANANFQIKHNGTGKENITITSKDETGKEISLEIPWEKIEEFQRNRKMLCDNS